jgi:iron complex transport system ATP-binding protein
METTAPGPLQSQHVRIGYDQHIVVDDLSLTIPQGRITVMVGANGSGKSTILKAFSRLLAPLDGAVLLDGQDIRSLRTRELAQRLSVLPQASQAPESLTVGELVSYGRFPHRRWLRPMDRTDGAMIRWALRVVGLEALEHRPVNALSGGQQQCAWIAMILAQGSSFLLLDEPTSNLDACHQLEVMELLARLNRDEGRTIVMVLHDLNLAARYAHHLVAIVGGRVVASGTPDEVMVPGTLKQVFGIDAHILRDPLRGTPLCVAYLPGPSPDGHGPTAAP